MAVELENAGAFAEPLKVERKSFVRADAVFKVVLGFFAFLVIVLLVWLGIELYLSSQEPFAALP